MLIASYFLRPSKFVIEILCSGEPLVQGGRGTGRDKVVIILGALEVVLLARLVLEFLN